ncbi:DUF2235 domain-containing protein [Herbaspirillum sp. YR522]|uniref:DUF2235 domain-containing protein n=1 Tax=Herbaspirillum sp. YR522 TaxID=1144342 RepID=UPI00026F651B|nr:DUF2235 domain-containing protein [Herbaspirillum sp. YR522]EJN07158.1 hypothetical protein PMI40_01979 [Herbaspirillum sp. YR522]
MDARKTESPDTTPPKTLLAMAAAAKAQSQAEKLTCQADIHMGFFFDGFGRSRDEDDPASSRYSNIARLWEAHRDNKDRRKADLPNQFWYRFYYSGLGTDLNADAANNDVVRAVTKVAENAGKAVLSNAGKVAAKVTGYDRVEKSVGTITKPKDPLKMGGKILKDSLTEMSYRPVVKAYKDIVKEAKALPGNARRMLRMASGDRWVMRGKASVRGLLYEVRKNPLKAGWAAAKTLAADVAADSIPMVRDNAASAKLFGTGVDVRLSAALDQFKAAYEDAKGKIPKVQRIHVSVFGADRGGVVARAFVNELARLYKRANEQDLAIDNHPIEIKFLGLLDSVASIMEENKLIGFLPLVGMIKQNYGDRPLGIPPSVTRCVHFAAAHELRFYQRLDSLEKTRGEQFLYPGTSEDVTGGSPDGALNFRGELQRVPLRDMLHEALIAGTMMDRMEDLRILKPETFRRFSLAEPVVEGKNSYQMMELVDAYRSVVPRTPGLDFLKHMSVFIQWLAVRYQSPEFRETVTSHVDDVKAAQNQRRERRERAEKEYMEARTAKPFDNDRYNRAMSEMFTAQNEETKTLPKTIMEVHRPFVSVWERLDAESKEVTQKRSDYQKQQDSEPERKAQWKKLTDAQNAGWRTMNGNAAAMGAQYRPARPLMTAEEVTLADAWINASTGKTKLPEKVMALFDLLVHDTMLTSWHDHILSSTLYFQTRTTDAFGKTDAKKEEETRKEDDANVARVRQLQPMLNMR